MSDNVGVAGPPRVWLRLEGAAVAVVGIWLFARGDGSWILFAALILTPDVSLAGYLAGPRAGAWAYNIAHSYVGPLLVAAWAVWGRTSLDVALIWAAHIGVDRSLGIGLKYATGFRDTHLGRIGSGGSAIAGPTASA